MIVVELWAPPCWLTRAPVIGRLVMTSRAAILPPQTVFGPARSTLTLDMASLDTSALSPALTTDDSSQLASDDTKKEVRCVVKIHKTDSCVNSHAPSSVMYTQHMLTQYRHHIHPLVYKQST